MFEQTSKNIDDILHKDAGCGRISHVVSLLLKAAYGIECSPAYVPNAYLK